MDEKKDENKSIKKKVLRWLLLVAIACVLGVAVLLIIMIPVLKGDVYYDKDGRHTKAEKVTDFPPFPDGSDHEPPTAILAELSNADIFEKGYFEYCFDIFSTGVTYIGSNNEPASGIEWKVYISDIRLSEEEIYALEETEPAAVNAGTIKITHGQWIYVLCNINASTADAPSESTFSITSIRGYA